MGKLFATFGEKHLQKIAYNTMSDIKDIEQNDTEVDINFSISMTKDLIQKIKFATEEELDKYLDDCEAFLCGNVQSKEYFKLTILGIVSGLLQVVYEMGIYSKQTLDRVYEVIIHISTLDTKMEVLNDLRKLIINVYESIDRVCYSRNFKVINKVKMYIDKYYTDENLCLEEIASKVFLCSSYLSAIFKEETGENLTEYISNLRMEKAQDLLLGTDMKIIELCTCVGYANQFYFSACFKKYIGVSPNEFRKKKLHTS